MDGAAERHRGHPVACPGRLILLTTGRRPSEDPGGGAAGGEVERGQPPTGRVGAPDPADGEPTVVAAMCPCRDWVAAMCPAATGVQQCAPAAMGRSRVPLLQSGRAHPATAFAISRTAKASSSSSMVNAGRSRIERSPPPSTSTRAACRRRSAASRCLGRRQVERDEQARGRARCRCPGHVAQARRAGACRAPRPARPARLRLDHLEVAPRADHVGEVAAPRRVDPRRHVEDVLGHLVHAAAGHDPADLQLLAERDDVGLQAELLVGPRRCRSCRSRSAPRRARTARRSRGTAPASPAGTPRAGGCRRPRPGSARR